MSRELMVKVEDVRLNYEVDTDTLYLDFEPDVEAEETLLMNDNVILRVKEGRLLGVTIVGFTKLIGFSAREF